MFTIQFNFMKPITPTHSNYIDFPLLEDRIHCVAFVFDANSIEQLSDEMVAKVKRARREMKKCGESYSTVLLRLTDETTVYYRMDLNRMKNL